MPIKLPSMLRKINRGFLGRLLLLGTSVGLSVAFCEVIIRLVAPQPPSWMPVYRPYGPPPYYGLEPNLRYLCDTGESRWLICTDDLGHRTSAQKSPPENPDAARFLLIGDSFTFGQGVNYEDSFAGILDRSQRRYQVINAGVGAYGPVEYRQALEQELKSGAAPQLVVVSTFLGNDITDCVRRQISSPEWITSQPGGLRNWIKRRTHLYRLASKSWHLLMPDLNTFTQFERNLYISAPWEEGLLHRGLLIYQEEFARIARICASRKITLCACIIPTENAVKAASARTSTPPASDGTLDFELPKRKVAAVFDRLAIPHVDTTSALARLGHEQAYFRHDGHLTPAGNRVVADAIRTTFLTLDSHESGKP